MMYLREFIGKAWTGFIWLSAGTIGGHFWTR